MMNYIIGAIVLVAIVLAIYGFIKTRKSGNRCDNCNGCNSYDNCKSKNKKSG